MQDSTSLTHESRNEYEKSGSGKTTIRSTQSLTKWIHRGEYATSKSSKTGKRIERYTIFQYAGFDFQVLGLSSLRELKRASMD
jgi:hypothetical protein